MPIRPENKDRYPSNWEAISRRVRFGRAAGRCECTGECGHRYGHRDHDGRCPAIDGQPNPATDSPVVLTVAHLDHTPENCAPANLKAMCQGCHLRYDAGHHATTAWTTRHRLRTEGMDPLFGPGAGGEGR